MINKHFGTADWTVGQPDRYPGGKIHPGRLKEDHKKKTTSPTWSMAQFEFQTVGLTPVASVSSSNPVRPKGEILSCSTWSKVQFEAIEDLSTKRAGDECEHIHKLYS